MQLLRSLSALVVSALLGACASHTRTPFTPEGGPPTVGMPAELSERERLFAPDIESVLRDQGLMPVRSGAGDMQIEFTMEAGPINTDTHIALMEGRRTVAQGRGRASGLPLVGRSKVAENSFGRAYRQFEEELRNAGSQRSWTRGAGPFTDNGDVIR
jgi:hypothetical protein